MTSSTLKQLDKMLAKARARHRGLPLYKLTPEQRSRYDTWLASQSADYEAYLTGTLGPQAPMPSDIVATLGLGAEPVGIPLSATEQEASQIYQDYLDAI